MDRAGWRWAGAAMALAATGSLLLPWLRSGRADYHTIDVLRSASVLEVVEGRAELGLLVAWLLVPLLAATALVAAAWERPQVEGAALIPLGLLLLVPVVAVIASPFSLRWGGVVGLMFGLISSMIGVVLVLSAHRRRTLR